MTFIQRNIIIREQSLIILPRKAIYEEAYTKYTHGLRVENDFNTVLEKVKGWACVEIFEDKIAAV